MPQSRSKIPVDQDFSILFLFSFLFNLSTRFLCIVSANFSYRAFSSFLTLFSLIACILLYDPKSVYDSQCYGPSALTCLSASFSSFISFSLAFTAAIAFRSS
jgi:hypothetical protein